MYLKSLYIPRSIAMWIIYPTYQITVMNDDFCACFTKNTIGWVRQLFFGFLAISRPLCIGGHCCFIYKVNVWYRAFDQLRGGTFVFEKSTRLIHHLWYRGFRRSWYLQAVCDSSVARTTGCMWPRILGDARYWYVHRKAFHGLEPNHGMYVKLLTYSKGVRCGAVRIRLSESRAVRWYLKHDVYWRGEASPTKYRKAGLKTYSQISLPRRRGESWRVRQNVS